MVYGLALAKELGLLEGITGYYFGNMEEWNDALVEKVTLTEKNTTRVDLDVILSLRRRGWHLVVVTR